MQSILRNIVYCNACSASCVCSSRKKQTLKKTHFLYFCLSKKVCCFSWWQNSFWKSTQPRGWRILTFWTLPFIDHSNRRIPSTSSCDGEGNFWLINHRYKLPFIIIIAHYKFLLAAQPLYIITSLIYTEAAALKGHMLQLSWECFFEHWAQK